MTDDTELNELGPVDWIVVEFPGSHFKGEMLSEIKTLESRGIIRLLDLVVLKKDADGSLECFELSDLEGGELGEIREDERQLAMLLSEADVLAVAEAVEPGSSAGLLVWENRWAAPFASAARRAGGQLVAGGRIPIQALLAAVEKDLEQEEA